ARALPSTRKVDGLEIRQVDDASEFLRHPHPSLGPITTPFRRYALEGMRAKIAQRPRVTWPFVAWLHGRIVASSLLFMVPDGREPSRHWTRVRGAAPHGGAAVASRPRPRRRSARAHLRGGRAPRRLRHGSPVHDRRGAPLPRAGVRRGRPLRLLVSEACVNSD